jgi:hypothetical protein
MQNLAADLRATWLPRRVSSALYTTPIPPLSEFSQDAVMGDSLPIMSRCANRAVGYSGFYHTPQAENAEGPLEQRTISTWLGRVDGRCGMGAAIPAVGNGRAPDRKKS